jgi:2-polyprenyl-3-methyl-5-hydroxy-6-metoxy-1,4-benzoquinol methylase
VGELWQEDTARPRRSPAPHQRVGDPTDVTVVNDPNFVGMMLLLKRLMDAGHPLNRQTVVSLAEIKLPKVAEEYDHLVGAMIRAGLLAGDSDAFVLTQDGRNLADEISEGYSLHALFYNEYYRAASRSKAHGLFCEMVYGRNLCQHGVADMEQINIAVSEFQAAGARSLLDFGCGDGRITEYVSDVTGMDAVGIDIADEAIRFARERTQTKRARMQFHWAYVEKGQGHQPETTFDCILAIDSIFFGNQEVILRWLSGQLAPGGQMGVFYICPSSMGAGNTPLAVAIETIGLAHAVKDLSARNAEHWARKEESLKELAPMFREEGNGFLYKNRMAECTKTMRESHRFLYMIRDV